MIVSGKVQLGQSSRVRKVWLVLVRHFFLPRFGLRRCLMIVGVWD